MIGNGKKRLETPANYAGLMLAVTVFSARCSRLDESVSERPYPLGDATVEELHPPETPREQKPRRAAGLQSKNVIVV